MFVCVCIFFLLSFCFYFTFVAILFYFLQACVCVFFFVIILFLFYLCCLLQAFSKVVGVPPKNSFIRKKSDNTWYQVLENTNEYCKHAPVLVSPPPPVPKTAAAPVQPNQANHPSPPSGAATSGMRPRQELAERAARRVRPEDGPQSETVVRSGAAEASATGDTSKVVAAAAAAAAAAGLGGTVTETTAREGGAPATKTGANENDDPPTHVSKIPTRSYMRNLTRLRFCCIRVTVIVYKTLGHG